MEDKPVHSFEASNYLRMDAKQLVRSRDSSYTFYKTCTLTSLLFTGSQNESLSTNSKKKIPLSHDGLTKHLRKYWASPRTCPQRRIWNEITLIVVLTGGGKLFRPKAQREHAQRVSNFQDNDL